MITHAPFENIATELLSTQDAVDAKALANCFLDWADDLQISVTPMKLQKLLYFSHAECIVILGKSLIKQEFEAWDYGPVIPSIYQEFKSIGKSPILTRALQFDAKTAQREPINCYLEEPLLTVVRDVFKSYANLSAERLSYISHVYDGPWFEARRLFEDGKNMDRRVTCAMIAQRHRGIKS